MGLCYAKNVSHFTVTDFDIVLVEDLVEFARLKRCLFCSKANILTILVTTLQLYCRLSHIIVSPLVFLFYGSLKTLLEFDILFIATVL